MMNVDEMKALLRKEFGINSVADLEREMRKIGGIRIAVFTDTLPKEAHDKKAATCQMVS